MFLGLHCHHPEQLRAPYAAAGTVAVLGLAIRSLGNGYTTEFTVSVSIMPERK